MMTDLIADMLTRIRNANSIYRNTVDVPHSKMIEGIAKKLKQEGFIQDYERVSQPVQDIITITLKYGPDGEKVIRTIKRISKPGRRVYKTVKDLQKKVLGGLGISIVSTSKGLITDRECRELNIGGEVLCTVW